MGAVIKDVMVASGCLLEIAVVEVPHRSKLEFLVPAQVLIEEETSRESLHIFHHLVDDIEACQRVYVENLLPTSVPLVGNIDATVGSRQQVVDIGALHRRQFLGRLRDKRELRVAWVVVLVLAYHHIALVGEFEQPSTSGIVGDRISETIGNLSRLCNEGMRETDMTVVSIMVGKNQSKKSI